MDSYQTIAHEAQGQYTQLRSKFLGFAYPVEQAEEALAIVEQVRKEYYDARHVCWAYRLGATGETTRINDDGEPSGTAGKPILGQIVSADLTNIIVLVVRYFGGVKLGTSGLIQAYREACVATLEEAERKTCILKGELSLAFGYDLMGEVMRLVKDSGARVLEQDFRESCLLRLSIRQDDLPTLEARLAKLYGVTIQET